MIKKAFLSFFAVSIIAMFSFGDFLTSNESNFTYTLKKNVIESLKKGKKNIKQVLSSERKKRVKGVYNKDQPDKFAQFHKGIRTRANEHEPSYNSNYKVEELLKARRVRGTAALNNNSYSSFASAKLNWIERGPGNVAGRVRTIIVDPDDKTNNTWFIGSASGGIWKTRNAGKTWGNLTKDLPNLSTSILAMSPKNTNIIYAGTGEGYGSFAFIQGQGIWKSADKGKTWDQITFTASNPDFGNVMRMVVDPNNENIVVVSTVASFRTKPGTNRKSTIYRTTDGGQNWIKVFENEIPEQGDPAANSIQQIIANPKNFNTLYATVHSNGVLKSVNAGVTWEKIYDSAFEGTARLEIAVSPTDTSRLYISAEGDPDQLFMSANAGKTWLKGKQDGGLDGRTWAIGQAFYDNTIAVHPYNENIVFVGGVDIFKFTFKEKVFSTFNFYAEVVADGYGSYGGSTKGVHVDHHALVLHPVDITKKTFRFLNGNDGGVAYSDDGGETFTQSGDTFLNDGNINPTMKGLNVSQFYGADKMNGGNRYVGGTQDNGSWFSPENPDTLSVWKSAPSGDGFEAAWHYGDPNKILESSQGNNIFRSLDGGKTWQNLAIPGSGQFLTKIENSKQDPDLVFTTAQEGVVRSDDFGTSWTIIELPDFGVGAPHAVARISLANPQVVWAASQMTSKNPVRVSTDGGFTFTKTKAPNITLGNITGIATHPKDESTAYALFSFANAPKVFRTTDLGLNWEELSGFGSNNKSSNSFPDVATYSLLVMPYNTNIIWAGTEIGIFESKDNGKTWTYANNGFPAVAAFQMRIINDQVIVATHGRGVWSVSLPELKGYEPTAVVLVPRITEFDAAIDGNISVKINLRATYDSTIVFVKNSSNNEITRLAKFSANSSSNDTSLSLSVNSKITATYQFFVKSYKENKSFVGGGGQFNVFALKEARASYSSNFDANYDDYSLKGMTISSESGFSGGALDSEHPYSRLIENSALLLVPITVSSSNAILKYDDIAIIEPGEQDASFGSPDFYDYVVVEGSKDYGKTWEPLADGYDATFNSEWQNIYRGKQAPTPQMFQTHEINLLDKFSSGDKILIRFRLFSDDYETGWGWIVDNLTIQEGVVGINKISGLPSEYNLLQNYPNPFNPATKIQYSIPKGSDVKITIFNLQGEEIKKLVNNQFQKAGSYEAVWNGVNNFGSKVSSGVYFYKIEANNFIQTRRMVLLK